MKLVDKIVIDKFIQSLEEDKEKWYKETGGAVGHTLTSYHSPIYSSEMGVDISFKVENGGCFTHINGIRQHSIGGWWNIFDRDMNRLRRSVSAMKSYVDGRIERDHNGNLLQIMRGMINYEEN